MTLDGTLVLVAAAIFFAGFVKGATGMGFPLIATPMLTLLLDIRLTIVVLLLPSVVMDLSQIFRRGFPTAIFQRFSSMFLFALAGVFLGTWELTQLPLWVLNLILGLVVILFAGFGLFAFSLTTTPRAEAFMSPVMGFAGGLCLGLTNTMGPVMAVYLHGLRLDKSDFVKAISTAFIMAKFWQIVAISTWGLFTVAALKLSLFVTTFVLVSFYLGLRAQDRIRQQTFNRAILVLLIGTGLTLVYRALNGA
jgi:uncharacterized membrane protein YfcA